MAKEARPFTKSCCRKKQRTPIRRKEATSLQAVKDEEGHALLRYATNTERTLATRFRHTRRPMFSFQPPSLHIINANRGCERTFGHITLHNRVAFPSISSGI